MFAACYSPIMETLHLSKDQIDILLSKTEGHFLDFKRAEIAPAKLTASLAAFCNADGGDIYVGIAETDGVNEWAGVSDPEDFNGHLQAFESVSPFESDWNAEFFTGEGREGYVLHVNALKSRQVRSDSKGVVRKRIGARNSPVEGEEALRVLRRQKGLESFEEETLNVELDEVVNSLHIIEFLMDDPSPTEPKIYLKRQQLIRNDMPTVASVLLYAELPQAILPKRCGIKIYRYKSNVAERDQLHADPVTIEGYIYGQIYEAVAKTIDVINEAKFLDVDGLRQVRYPREALHEVITNAVLHRDYSVQDDIHVRIFENRVEVQSPGRLPGHITRENILEERLSRNGHLVRNINRFTNPPNKDVGEGLNTAFESMRKFNLQEPVIQERDNSVVVIIRHQSLASPEQQIMEYLEEHEQIRNREARDLVGIESESKMQKVLKGLVEAGEIEHVPGTAKRGYAYRALSGTVQDKGAEEE